MSWNTFGRVFRFTTWGESHGPAIGAVVDGCPPGIALAEVDIQPWLDRRKPGQSKYTTQRREPDQVRILSGVFEGRTTGTLISLMIENVDQRSKDHSEVAQAYRPGHADYTYDAKYGFRDYRGGGRSSARETAMRVAVGAVARLVIPQVRIRAWVEQIGEAPVLYSRFDANDRPQSLLVPRSRDRAEVGADRGRSTQIRQFCRRSSRLPRRGCARRLGRTDLCQARQRAGERDDEHQRGQGRGDR